jgi:hypothetical protein
MVKIASYFKMMKRSPFLPILILTAQTLCAQNQSKGAEEKHLKNLRQITFGGDNAEAYFSPDGKKLCFQTNNPAWGLKCDQIYRMNLQASGSDSAFQPHLISTGQGRTTCSYYLPGGKEIIYASTHLAGKECPPPPAPRADRKYLWAVYSEFDIFVADEQGKNLRQLTSSPGLWTLMVKTKNKSHPALGTMEVLSFPRTEKSWCSGHRGHKLRMNRKNTKTYLKNIWWRPPIWKSTPARQMAAN